MPSLLRAENIIDIEDVVAVLVIVAIILHTLARLGQDTTGIPYCRVLEARVADLIGSGEVLCEGLERLSRVYPVSGRHKTGGYYNAMSLTLMKPPSGLARLNGG